MSTNTWVNKLDNWQRRPRNPEGILAPPPAKKHPRKENVLEGIWRTVARRLPGTTATLHPEMARPEKSMMGIGEQL
ncbi:unnamed protein product [Mycena citricolor]|uniref:Uncharacterized protein n=1 Tax=Mycena citricolor TaxID=2018698 RepID=A0AAD2JUX7_9AGAR|nr:unnamed protein product [Mycena citricolor]